MKAESGWWLVGMIDIVIATMLAPFIGFIFFTLHIAGLICFVLAKLSAIEEALKK